MQKDTWGNETGGDNAGIKALATQSSGLEVVHHHQEEEEKDSEWSTLLLSAVPPPH